MPIVAYSILNFQRRNIKIITNTDIIAEKITHSILNVKIINWDDIVSELHFNNHAKFQPFKFPHVIRLRIKIFIALR
jgi:hypothetical protein